MITRKNLCADPKCPFVEKPKGLVVENKKKRTLQCNRYFCDNCGWNKQVEQQRKKDIRAQSARGTLIDEDLKARANTMLQEDLASGAAFISDCGINSFEVIIWDTEKGRVYR